jgi:hypothetical protein
MLVASSPRGLERPAPPSAGAALLSSSTPAKAISSRLQSTTTSDITDRFTCIWLFADARVAWSLSICVPASSSSTMSSLSPRRTKVHATRGAAPPGSGGSRSISSTSSGTSLEGHALSTRRGWIGASRATSNRGPWGLAACSLLVAGPCTLLSLTGSRGWVSTTVGQAESLEVSSACAGCSPLAPSSPKLVAVGTSSRCFSPADQM